MVNTLRIDNQHRTVTIFPMATITLKNVPADLHQKLKKRAEEHIAV